MIVKGTKGSFFRLPRVFSVSLPPTASSLSSSSHVLAWTVTPMQLTEKDIKEFIEAWRRDFNETLTEADARHRVS